jgi:D-glycero-alpha-D-manno-heptose-7-phosphate kinase
MIVTQTPLRVSFAGGGTDFEDFYRVEDGAVVSSAIDKYIYVIVKKRFDDKIRVGYSKTEIVDSVDDLKHELVRESMKKVGITKGIEISTMADIPSTGTGLGSSSSVTVGLLNALYAYRGIVKPAEELAQEACDIEIGILKKPIGKQDQYIAAYGDVRCFEFRNGDGVRTESLGLSEEQKSLLAQNMMLFYTGLARDSADILCKQKEHIDQKRDILRRMKQLAVELRSRLLAGDMDAVGRVMHEGWLYKKQLADGITNGHINIWYERAMNSGATGGKVTGAGGGGFLLFYCPAGRQNNVRCALKELRELRFGLEGDGSKVIFNVRR